MTHNFRTLWDTIYSSLKNYADTKHLSTKFSLEEPKNINRGSYATNLALVLAKHEHKNPLVIAEEVVAYLKQHLSIASAVTINIAKPGFINFSFDDELMLKICRNVLTLGDNYGRGQSKKYKYNIEIVSANPTGLLHIGHARNGVIGDSVARLLSFQGYDVTVEHYTNNAGNQINILALTIFINYLKMCNRNRPLPEECYQGDFYHTPAAIIFEKYGSQFQLTNYSENKILDNNVNEIFKQVGVDYFLNKIKEHLKLLDINIDYYISEKHMYESGAIKKTLAVLDKNKASYKADGALWLRTTLKHDDKDRVIIKSDGSYTYLLPDLTSHWDKVTRTQADKLVDFWGGDHHDYVKRMQIGLEFLGLPPKTLDVDVISMVKLVKGGQEYKMSKRAGTAVWLIDLYNAVGSDAMRYMMASKPGSTPMELDIEILQSESHKNSIFYIKYAALRCASIIRHFIADQSLPDIPTKLEGVSLTMEERVILNKLDIFPLTARLSAQYRMPHMMCDYAFDLARRFHSFYNKYKVLNLENQLLTFLRLAIIRSVFQVLKSALHLIGIKIEINNPEYNREINYEHKTD